MPAGYGVRFLDSAESDAMHEVSGGTGGCNLQKRREAELANCPHVQSKRDAVHACED